MALLLNTNDIVTAVNYRYKTTVVDNGKNLFDDKNHGKRLDTNGNLINDINAFCTDYIPTNTAQRYTADCYINHSDSSVYAWILCCYDDNKNMIRRYTNTMRSFSFTIQSGEKYFILCKRYSNSQAEQFLNVQLEEGTTATPYVPYREPITTTIYSDEPYFTNDYIHKDKDGGVEHRGWVKKRVTEVFSADKLSNGLSRVAIALSPSAVLYTESRSYCNIVGYNANYSVVGHVATSNTCYITLPIEELSSVTTANKWFSEHEVYVWYRTSTPTDTPKDLPEILLVNGYNSIDTDTEIKPEKMSITYKATKERAEYDLQLTNSLLDVMKGM